jgi:signal peptidase II
VYYVQSGRRISLEITHPGRLFVITALAVLVTDQVTKVAVRAMLPVGTSRPGFIPHIIDLTSVRNSGAAFGIFPGQRPIFVLTSLLVLFAIAAFWRHVRPRQWPVVAALAAVAGGAVGNLIDRAFIGYVTDFFEFAFVQFPVFNVADIGLVCGVGVLMIWILFGPETLSPSEESPVEALGDEADSEGDVAVGEPR